MPWTKNTSGGSVSGVSSVNGSTGDVTIPTDPRLDRFKSKKWCVIGDSITQDIYVTSHYWTYIKQWQGIGTIYNQGLAGTGFMKDYSTSVRITNRLDQVPSDTDIITIFAGTNDIGLTQGVLGDTDPTVSMYGAIDYTIKTLQTNFPNVPIGVITPLPRSDYYPSGSGNAGLLLQKIVTALNDVSKKYGVPILDLYYQSGLRPWDVNNKTQFFYNADGIHPNNLGHLQIAYKIHDFLLKL